MPPTTRKPALAGRALLALLAAVAVALTLATPAWAARAGNHQIAAHAGDREAKPAGWKEDEWENSVQAIGSAFTKGARWIEVDLQLNRHPDAITPSTPYGILYLHHNRTCEEITTSGQGTGVTRSIGTAAPSLVDRCAERLSNVLNRWAYPNRWLLEMKADTGYGELLPKALYALLKAKGWRTTSIVSSLDQSLLSDLQDEAARDGVTMQLMRVVPYGTRVDSGIISATVRSGYSYLTAEMAGWIPLYVQMAKDQGLYVGGWHWVDTSPTYANQRAVELDLDIMITDSISDLQARGWS